MMKKYIFIIGLFLFFISCEKKDIYPHSYPCCIQKKIDYILENPATNPRAKIDKYYYKKQYVYVVYTNYPDFPLSRYDENCNLVCSSGGFDGSNNTCDDWENAKFIETVWTDNR